MRNINYIAALDYQDMSSKAAQLIAAQLQSKPDSLLGLATGSTPVGMYQNLVSLYRKGAISFDQASSVNLDEYVGLQGEHPQSYRYFMQQHLFDQVDIQLHNTHLPDGTAEDVAAECSRYDRLIEELGRADIQVLGLGHNGHIAFNEPSQSFSGNTHCVALTDSTIEANRRFFKQGEQVPSHALTMGIKQIMGARQIILLVSGGQKAQMLHRAMTGEITPMVPASVLQLHPCVTVIADTPALACFDKEELDGEAYAVEV